MRKNKHSLFGRIDNSAFQNFRDNLFVGPFNPFTGQTGFGYFLLFVAVIVNYGRVLTFHMRCQSIFMVVPEQIQQLQIAHFRWIEIN